MRSAEIFGNAAFLISASSSTTFTLDMANINARLTVTVVSSSGKVEVHKG
ncbi:MAG: hypothetical protein ACLRSW_00825 [Christensenellaceae bacterium]